MRVKANCKINIGLNVLRRRSDGFHDLETVMFPVKGLYDELSIERTHDGRITLCQSGIVVDCPPEANLCVKAARLMQNRYGIDGVAITLDKRVPFGAGLGGGSSDATAVLLAIDQLYNLDLPTATLVALAAELGSDTPFFVHNSPQLCTSRGEVMSPIDLPLDGKYLVVVKPDEGVSTREAYGGVKPAVPTVGLSEALRLPLDKWQGLVANDFEQHIFAAHPKIAALKKALLDAGAVYASMSGSGSALFGIFNTPPQLNLDKSIFTHIEKL